MPSKLMLDPKEPGIADVIAAATVGEPLVLREVTVIPSAITDSMFEADISAVTMTEMEEMPEVEETEEQGEMPMKGMPMTNEGGYDEGGM